ncbi:MAG: TonB family protein [Bacteroidales bacterium]|nr:TonB family protein [Bacteroidales bacterium]
MGVRVIIMMMLALMPAFSALAQYRDPAGYQELDDSENVASIKSHVRYLSSAMLEGRKAGSDGEKLAAEYVAEVFQEYGVELITPKNGESFGIVKDNGDTLTSRNVIGCVQGYDKNLRNQYIVVGARLDNLGSMMMIQDGVQKEKILYGANGNASGLSMMLELARMVQTNSIVFRRSVLFVAFGASKETYAGAWYFLNRSFQNVPQIDAMINLDMLGTGYNGFYAYTSSNVDMNALLDNLKTGLQPILPEITATEPYPSDHRAFYSIEIPSVLFTTGRYPQHDTERDTQSIIDYEIMERELEYIYNFTEALANAETAPKFRPDEAPKQVKLNDDVVSFYDCDQRPIFLHSSDPKDFLQKWVYQYLRYPAEAVRDGVQGRVMIEFVIEKDGSVTDVHVVKGVSEELDAEALRVVAASPKWKPGRVNGNKVRTSLTIPVEFKLEKKGEKSSFGIKKY